MMGPLQIVAPGAIAALFLFSATAAPSAEPSTDFEGDACRCVDEPMTVDDLPTTSSLPAPKVDKVYPSVWRPAKKQGSRRVSTTLFNVHSKEALPVLDGQLPPIEILDNFFRCRGFGTIHPLEGILVQTAVAAALHFQSPRVEVISGFRSPKFNDSLAKKGRGVAGESNHTRGSAMDFRLTTTEAATVAKWLHENFTGGVGTYVINNFVHIDTGPKRRWNGR